MLQLEALHLHCCGFLNSIKDNLIEGFLAWCGYIDLGSVNLPKLLFFFSCLTILLIQCLEYCSFSVVPFAYWGTLNENLFCLEILHCCIQVAIPVVPTIRVLVTFTKFEELQPVDDEFATPPSSPTAAGRESPAVTQSSSSSWFQWIKGPYSRPSSTAVGSSSRIENIQDPFAIPQDYTWITAEAKKKKMQDKNKSKKSRSQNQ